MSGEALAADLGISRAAVSAHVAALREAGLSIESTRHRGHRLTGMPPFAVSTAVGAQVADPLWVRFEGTATTVSTNDDAKRLARGAALEGTVVVAARQEGGRGRLGRSWESPRGGAYFSAVLRPSVAPAVAPSLALVVAVGVADGLAGLGVETTLKWPNDVLLDGRKLVGVLLEMSAEADKVEWVVAGVGVNVLKPHADLDGFAYLEDVVSGADPSRVAAVVLDGIAAAYRSYLSVGFPALVDSYARRDGLLGRAVVVRDGTGVVIASGEAKGVDELGRLRVGETSVFAGEVTLRDKEGGVV